MNFDPFLDYDEDQDLDPNDPNNNVYIIPMCQFPLANIKTDYEFVIEFLEFLVNKKEDLVNFEMISGYLNPTDEMIELLEEIKSEKMLFVGASPEVIISIN